MNHDVLQVEIYILFKFAPDPILYIISFYWPPATQYIIHMFVSISLCQNILGAAILGVGGDEAIHSILDIMNAKQPYTMIQRATHIHPTVSELIPTMLGDLKPLH